MDAEMNDGPTGREFGALEERVKGLDSKFRHLEGKIDALGDEVGRKLDELMALRERGRGAMWAMGGVGTMAGAAGAWLVKVFSAKGGV